MPDGQKQINVSEDVHKQVKIKAATEGKTISQVVTEALGMKYVGRKKGKKEK